MYLIISVTAADPLRTPQQGLRTPKDFLRIPARMKDPLLFKDFLRTSTRIKDPPSRTKDPLRALKGPRVKPIR